MNNDHCGHFHLLIGALTVEELIRVRHRLEKRGARELVDYLSGQILQREAVEREESALFFQEHSQEQTLS